MSVLTITAAFDGRKLAELKPAELAMYDRALRQVCDAVGESRADPLGANTTQGAARFADLADAKLEVLGLMTSPDMVHNAA